MASISTAGLSSAALGTIGVDEHGDVAAHDDGAGLGHGVGQAGANALDLALAQADGLGEAHGAANGRRRGQIAHDDLAAGAMQANGDASGDVAAPLISTSMVSPILGASQ